MALPTVPALIVTAAAAVIYAIYLPRFNEEVDVPYMDEVFHVPQAQKYCAGRYDEWDPKITTFPGVYLAGVAVAQLTELINLVGFNGPVFCSLSVLRYVNVLFGVGNAYLISRIRRQVMPPDNRELMIVAFPVLFFFSLLFYTDAGATFFVLLMYLLAIQVDLTAQHVPASSFLTSAMAGAAAVLFRQTNIVWVVFVAGTLVVRIVESSQSHVIYGSTNPSLKQRGADLAIGCHSAPRVLVKFVLVVLAQLPTLVPLLWPFIAIVVSFVAFLLHNGGIVVGDKSNHEAGFHGAQVLYFIFVASTGLGPMGLLLPAHLTAFARAIRRKTTSLSGLVFLCSAATLVLLVIHLFSPVHKFMLADNRHYTFYVWRKFFLKHALAKFLPAPVYVYQAWRLWIELRRTCSPLWILVFCIATVLVLVPSPLVEPRYYIIPFVLLHLHMPTQISWHMGATIAVYTIVNIVTIHAFLYRPYQWVDGTTARFMW